MGEFELALIRFSAERDCSKVWLSAVVAFLAQRLGLEDHGESDG